MSIDPTEDAWVVLRRTTMCDTIGPVLGESVLACGGFKSTGAYFNAHDHVGFVILGIVAPQCVQLLFNATLTYNVRK